MIDINGGKFSCTPKTAKDKILEISLMQLREEGAEGHETGCDQVHAWFKDGPGEKIDTSSCHRACQSFYACFDEESQLTKDVLGFDCLNKNSHTNTRSYDATDIRADQPLILGLARKERNTYTLPARNTPMTPNLVIIGSFNCHTVGMGKNRIMTSVKRLGAEVEM